MQKTSEEIQALKDGWTKDPCWDIEDTEGFEDHHDELLAWREDLENKHRLAANARRELRLEKVKNVTGILDDAIADHIFTFEEIESDLDRQGQLGIARAQVRASLLIAAQIKRVGDILQDMSAREAGESHQDFMTRLYKVD